MSCLCLDKDKGSWVLEPVSHNLPCSPQPPPPQKTLAEPVGVQPLGVFLPLNAAPPPRDEAVVSVSQAGVGGDVRCPCPLTPAWQYLRAHSALPHHPVTVLHPRRGRQTAGKHAAASQAGGGDGGHRCRLPPTTPPQQLCWSWEMSGGGERTEGSYWSWGALQQLREAQLIPLSLSRVLISPRGGESTEAEVEAEGREEGAQGPLAPGVCSGSLACDHQPLGPSVSVCLAHSLDFSLHGASTGHCRGHTLCTFACKLSLEPSSSSPTCTLFTSPPPFSSHSLFLSGAPVQVGAQNHQAGGGFRPQGSSRLRKRQTQKKRPTQE